MGIDRKYQVPKITTANEAGPLLLRVMLLLTLFIGFGWFGYHLGELGLTERIVGFNPFTEKRLKSLQDERDELRRQLNLIQQEAQMDKIALQAVRDQIKQLQDERMEMEEELAFLRGIVSNGSNKTGLRVQKFKLKPGVDENEYTYQFTVTQVINSGTWARGRALIRLQGLQDGKNATLELKEVSEDKLQDHKMRFRFFQDIEGKLKLPTGFSPVKVIIEVEPEDKKMDEVTAIYDWPK